MNRYWHVILYCFIALGCHGQKENPTVKGNELHKDSVLTAIDSTKFSLNRLIQKDTIKEGKLDSVKADVIKKKVLKKEIKEEKEIHQTKTAKIWNEDQVAFLNQVDKILLFHVRITEIGSRKLELDSQLENEEHQGLIKVLLSEDSYPSSKMEERSSAKKFVPNYQILLEKGEERLTLMFDKEGLKMVVASLYGREKYNVTPQLIACVEKLKKGK